MPVAAAITALGSLLGSIASYRMNQRQNQNMMALQNRYNRENWAMQNAYNSPSAQMARLKAAGLNPNLIYQNGGANIGAGEIGSPQSMDVQAPDFSAAISHGVDVYNAGLQADSVQSQIDLNQAQRSKIIEESITQALTNKYLPMEKRAQLASSAAQTANFNAQSNLLAQQKDYYCQLTGLTRQQIQNASLDYSKSLVEIQNLHDQHKINGVEFNRLSKLCSQIDAQTDLIKKQSMQAFLNNSLLNMRLLANRGKSNEFTMALDYLEQQIEQLNFENSVYGRSDRLAPKSVWEFLSKSNNRGNYHFNEGYIPSLVSPNKYQRYKRK